MTYDFIIIGAGSAGCALARRLSEPPEAQVLLIEAGGSDAHPSIRRPTSYYDLWTSEFAWPYTSVPQKGTAYRRHPSPRGKVIGGSSSINGMVYFRGAAADYDNWAYQGNVGWDWSHVCRAFVDLERELQPAQLADPNPMSEIFLAACIEAGHRTNADFDSGQLLGAGWNRLTIKNGQRQSSYRAFLAPVKSQRPNLTIVPSAQATRLLVTKQGDVSGVEYVSVEHKLERRVGRETILCCGAFDSPKLLLLSGIGPAAELESLGIRPLVDLPVGQNLTDHVLLGIAYQASQPIPRRHAHLTEATLFAYSSQNAFTPDVQISFNKEKHFADAYDAGEHAFTIIPGITRPKSRGWLKLRSADWREQPLINPRHLEEEGDLRALLAGITMAREIGDTDALAPYRAREVAPGADVASDQAVRRYIAAVASTWFHASGTCKMGVDARSVVAPDLRVYGTRGLRVADASVMPDIVSANTNGAATMIGWRAADMLLRG